MRPVFARWRRQRAGVRFATALGLTTLLSVIAALSATGWVPQFDLAIYYRAVSAWVAGAGLYSYAQPDEIMGSLGFTYPPFAAIVMSPMTLLSFGAVRVLTVLAIVVAGGVLVHLLLTDRVGPGLARRTGWAAAVVLTPVAFMVESLRENLSFGQINVFLVLLVVADVLVLGRRRSRWFGVGIGLAGALKITPGIAVLYLLVTRRWRAALTAVATAAVVTGLAAAIAPRETWDFFTGLLWDTTRVGRPESILDQSVNGWLARWFAPEPVPRPLWAVLAAALVGIGLYRAARLYRGGDDLAGLTVVGLVGIAVSPVSWIHHAVWVLPALAVIADRWWRLRGTPGRGRTGLLVLGLTGMLIWGMQPTSYIRTDIDDWPTAGVVTLVLSGLPVLWCVIAILVLPGRRTPGVPLPSRGASGTGLADEGVA
nr:glycosyltransferase 87 family protein [Nakamurella flavida]